jgi:mannose-1-phosphate guanylyltransferase
MQALILVGGEGTRLRPLTETVPKPVMPLAGRPFLSYMIDWLGQHGVEEAVLACGFGASTVRDVLGEGGGGGPRLHYVEEPEALGTAGAIKFAADRLGERFLVLNGDVLSDLDLSALIRFHHQQGARATLGLYPVANPAGYGLVSCSDEGAIREFLEKPDPAQARAGDINAGTYVLERSVLDLIPDGRPVSIEREIFPRLIGEGLYGLRLAGYWMDIGTPERYLQASWDILERRVHTVLDQRLDESGRLLEGAVEVADGARIEGPALVENGARIGTRATVGPRAVIGPGCEVGPEASISSSVLHANCRLGQGARVSGAVVAAGAEVAAGAKVRPGSVIAAGESVVA